MKPIKIFHADLTHTGTCIATENIPLDVENKILRDVLFIKGILIIHLMRFQMSGIR